MDSLLYDLREIPLHRKAAREELAAFLARHGLSVDPMLEKYYGVFRDDALLAGAGYDRNVIKCVAVEEASRGEGLVNALVSHIVTKLVANGIDSLVVFTKAENGKIFESLGFTAIASTEDVVLLINNPRELDRCRDHLATLKQPGTTGALVMNCNPFTLGHRYLVETAAKECDRVVLFVVEEDASAFPFSVRLRLVREGVSDLANVSVVPGGQYVISSATFPSYFIKEASDAARACANLDATLFGKIIAPAAGISVRFVGDEPTCALTNLYNEALKTVLPAFGVRLEVIERLRQDGEAISASRVRALAASGDLEAVKRLVPDSTFRCLASGEVKLQG